MSMARENSSESTPSERTRDDIDGLAFLRDEGLDLLFLFRRIRDQEKRAVIMALVNALGEDEGSS